MTTGRLRVYLGAAHGVGKTYAMLDEGSRRRERGTDVVVAFADTHGRPRTAAQMRDLEIVPRLVSVSEGKEFADVDVAAVLARRPAVALIDDLARSNSPRSRNRWRYQDAEELLAVGIDVVATVDISELSSVQDVIERLVGERSPCVVPDAMLRSADQVELVDMTPEALRRRVAHGNVVAEAQIATSLDSAYRIETLAALRELALLWVADQVEERLQQYEADHALEAIRETRERIVVALTGAPTGERLIRRAARLAQRSTSDLIGVHVRSSRRALSESARERLEEQRALLLESGGEFHEVVDDDPARALLAFARARQATQVVLGTSRQGLFARLTSGSITRQILEDAGSLDVHIISDAEHGDRPSGFPMLARRHDSTPTRRRQLLAGVVGASSIAALTTVLAQLHPATSLSTDLLLFLLVVLGVALLGGVLAGVLASIVSFLAVNWFLTQPLHTFTISGGQDLVALITFFVVSLLMSLLVSRLSIRSSDAERARAEAEGLARAAASLVGSDEAVAEIVDVLRSSFDRRGVALVVPASDGGWRIEARAGDAVDLTPGSLPTIPVAGGAQLIHDGPPLNADDERVLHAFCAHLGSALDRRQLEAEAAEAAAAAQGDRLRTAILRAVSHDLRTPLSSIKASASSLLQSDVDWTPEARAEFLTTIDEEADRLNIVVGNLLDMSRLEAGVIRPARDAVDLEETVQFALAGLSEPVDMIDVDLPAELPCVAADQALLQQALSNLLANALRHGAKEGARISVMAIGWPNAVELRIIDRGPGLRAEDRERLFEPFQRLSDRGGDTGVGLGLAVARGFLDAMGGSLELGDTPGGGITAIVGLPIFQLTDAIETIDAEETLS